MAWVDIGFRGAVKVPKSELKMSQLLASKGTGGARTSPEDFRQGDVLTFLIETVSDAFGDTLLSTGKRPPRQPCICDPAPPSCLLGIPLCMA